MNVGEADAHMNSKGGEYWSCTSSEAGVNFRGESYVGGVVNDT
jgi:hypothetical protein